MAPGTILQLMFLRSRIRSWPETYKTFYDIGSGTGLISNALLSYGFRGQGFDLNKKANAENRKLNLYYIKHKKFRINRLNFNKVKKLEKVDIIISSFLIEHLQKNTVKSFLARAHHLLKPNGLIVTIVPGNPSAWGIEDEIAGHLRRYDFKSVFQLAQENNFKIKFLHGLTWPISNILLPISNILVYKSEKNKLKITRKYRTIASGFRKIKFKTEFPSIWKICLNKYVLSPFYLLQLLAKKFPSCLVIYFEMKK